MRYTSIVREVLTRMNFHAAHLLLEGLNVKKVAEWRVDGDKDLPRLTLIDLNFTESPGRSTAKLTLFLSTKRKDGYVSLTDERTPGLIDWAERVLDAIETKPSDGSPDPFLCAHTPDGDAVLTGTLPVQLLPVPLEWDVRMAEINDSSFTLQLDLSFKPALTRTASRRATPIPPL